jgi:hypothetical protein
MLALVSWNLHLQKLRKKEEPFVMNVSSRIDLAFVESVVARYLGRQQ